MKAIVYFLLVVIFSITVNATKFTYSFSHTPLSEALVKIGKDHPDLTLSFIYKDLDNYKTSAKIDTEDAYEALRKTIGLNPVTIVSKNGEFFIEALQHGKFHYTGRVLSQVNEGVEAATVMLLTPSDSTVITYGFTDGEGRFSIPCDRTEVIAKFSCLGYKPLYKKFENFNMGTIYMVELPVKLKNIDVNADDAISLADKNIYLPTKQQKNAAQTATDLLARMSIPQLDVRLGSSSITTAGGEAVGIFIDYIPATSDDLKMMKMSDVKTVEYLDYPSDPRFGGKRHVINFRLVKYEYGGYFKALGNEDFIINSGYLQANARLSHGKMTYDIMGYGYYIDNDHFGTEQTETFHLPQEDGSPKVFDRSTSTEHSEYRSQSYIASFRALYNSNKITANNQLYGGQDNTPANSKEGSVVYSYAPTDREKYASASSVKEKYLRYNGYYFFILPKNNTLSADLSYLYSKTSQKSNYAEVEMKDIWNDARDRSHNFNLSVNYNHVFSESHSIYALGRALYEHNDTRYSGSVNTSDISITKYGQLGIGYNYSGSKFSGSVDGGWSWTATTLNSLTSFSQSPYFDASLSYRFNKKNSIGSEFHYSVWPPSSNYKSENVIHVSPYLWYTGNPVIKSRKSYDFSIYYTWILSPKFRMTLIGSSWRVGNRPAFVYEATPQGIIRTIRQPIGSFGHYDYGARVTSKLINGKLQLSGKVGQLIVKNGAPYNITRSQISFYLQAFYYLGNFNFAAIYQSASATDNYDCMSGVWSKLNDTFILQAGWSNGIWNVRLSAQNLQRWNWRASYDEMESEYYSFRRWTSNASSHALIRLSATYTFGYGKKVKRNDELTRQGGASSGILK